MQLIITADAKDRRKRTISVECTNFRKSVFDLGNFLEKYLKSFALEKKIYCLRLCSRTLFAYDFNHVCHYSSLFTQIWWSVAQPVYCLQWADDVAIFFFCRCLYFRRGTDVTDLAVRYIVTLSFQDFNSSFLFPKHYSTILLHRTHLTFSFILRLHICITNYVD